VADVQAYRKLYEDGVVIVDDFFDGPSEDTDGYQKDYPKALFKCTPSQATYVTKAGVSRDVVYDAVIRSAVTAGYDSVFGKQDHKTKTKEVTGPVVRQQLRACKANHEEMKKYHFQMDLLLKSMFPNGKKNNKADPANWMCKMTNMVGGLEYQHPHADQGWGLDYDGEETFPFVATHAFGVNPFQMWLLTKGKRGKNDYGFLHTMKPSALLLMRGDFIHAGGILWFPRCHMKFYPRLRAGLVKGQTCNYWHRPTFQCDIDAPRTDSDEEKSFLWQHYVFLFAYPKTVHTLNKTSKIVEEVVTYIPGITHGLMDEDKAGRQRARNKVRYMEDTYIVE
jgi:hypothetical protein